MLQLWYICSSSSLFSCSLRTYINIISQLTTCTLIGTEKQPEGVRKHHYHPVICNKLLGTQVCKFATWGNVRGFHWNLTQEAKSAVKPYTRKPLSVKRLCSEIIIKKSWHIKQMAKKKKIYLRRPLFSPLLCFTSRRLWLRWPLANASFGFKRTPWSSHSHTQLPSVLWQCGQGSDLWMIPDPCLFWSHWMCTHQSSLHKAEKNRDEALIFQRLCLRPIKVSLFHTWKRQPCYELILVQYLNDVIRGNSLSFKLTVYFFSVALHTVLPWALLQRYWEFFFSWSSVAPDIHIP